MRHPAWDYEFMVKSEKGESVPLTSRGEEMLARKNDNGRRIVKRINPGETVEETIVINEFYDIGAVGRYTVTATRRFYKGNTGNLAGRVKKSAYEECVSNTVVVETIP